ncbi:MAG: creatininase [Nitrososphaeraceae archaeon]|nr:creatininase [Nitrososphaeraceae archaeon]
MPKNNEFLIEEMNAIQVKKNINQNTVAILVFGACENHGNHMPFGADFIFPYELAKQVANKKENIIVFPPMPYGVSLHHDQFQMTMSINPDTLVNVISDLLVSVITNNINRILIINGHDGNISPIEIASRLIKNKYPYVTIACLESWWELIGKLEPSLFNVWGGLGHGGEAETSAMLAVRSDLVNIGLAPENVIPKLPNHVRIYWKFNELTETGATGSPKNASVQKGESIMMSLENVLLSFIDEMNLKDWKYGIFLK